MMRDSNYPEFVEIDPTGRYGRYNEVLGKGASKTVYRAFDEYEGIEVAWNQVKLYDFLQSPDDLERLYCEIHLLKTLKHKNIMKFYASWVDLSKRNINFVTEMFTSGTLRQYRQMHRRVHIRAVKHWCRQILMGLLYLHSHDPPIIHRDLKCDNIFINGNQGEVKIGDLGLAAILRKSHAVHCVGTPEFMAPEVYEEEYNELVDIYSFGMCVLEMVTFEYPYSECKHPAQIYKKVISGSKPGSLYRVRDPGVRRFIEKCLATVSERLSARELLMDPFLQNDDLGSGSWEAEIIKMGPLTREPTYTSHHSSDHFTANQADSDLQSKDEMNDDCDENSTELETHGIELFNGHEDEDEHFASVDISIKGRKGEDGCVFIRLKIRDKEGHVRNVYFPFDVDTDSALGVAAEMVDELDITDHEVTRIAEMIDGEVSSLVPEWNARMDLKERNEEQVSSCSHDCKSNSSPRATNIGSCSISYGQFKQMTHKGDPNESLVLHKETVVVDDDDDSNDDDTFDDFEVPKQMTSFHLSRNCSLRRPDVDAEPYEDRSMQEEIDKEIALEKIFNAKNCYVGNSFPTSLPRARSLCI